MLDLSKIAGKKVAVHVSTVEKAEVFIAAMQQHFPNKVGFDPVPVGSIALYEGHGYSGFCYYPRFHEKRKMSYGSRETYDDWGVPVLEFEDLLVTDLVTLMSDMPIEVLLNGCDS